MTKPCNRAHRKIARCEGALKRLLDGLTSGIRYQSRTGPNAHEHSSRARAIAEADRLTLRLAALHPLVGRRTKKDRSGRDKFGRPA